ncbi:MAG TPA: ribose-phosphate pyrophosphokinase [Candidatus Ornithomonoglobus intestinigallinarum]|uniref:ribose-phosphate diphosphokinase n=1 Tax=Candidatus Ornithomonoglobus intestinigallinarum TaxID=2840894 RepID=A0A9D1KQN4_9FIRM|nr:ribose-phosphate pyrophosphokinase [Candidatus Ornithomonoglobus intestinigallinarum]
MTKTANTEENPIVGKLTIISMKGCEEFTAKIDEYLKEWRPFENTETYVTHVHCPRFGTGEGKCVVDNTVRGHDVYIICDVFNYGITYKMYGIENHMSPDDHYQDLKRIIAAMGGKARRVTVVMPMLYEGRQHRRSGRESLDAALMLHELVNMGVSNIITFDAHDPRIANAIPLSGFDDVQPTYQMIKAIAHAVPDISLNKFDTVVISPDEGGMSRCMYYSSMLKLDLGMFYKRRDYSRIVDGKNPIVAHEYLGREVSGKDVIIVDDMISSGESIIDVATALKKQGAKRIFVFASFGLFVNGLGVIDEAYEKGIINKIFTTNLVYQQPGLVDREWYYSVDMSKYISLLINTLNHDDTISELLNPVKKIQALVDRMESEANK